MTTTRVEILDVDDIDVDDSDNYDADDGAKQCKKTCAVERHNRPCQLVIHMMMMTTMQSFSSIPLL